MTNEPPLPVFPPSVPPANAVGRPAENSGQTPGHEHVATVRIGLQVRVTGGKYNGFEGTVLKACETVGSIVVILENKAHELVVDLAHLTELTQWRASKSATELALKGAS